MAGRFVVYSPEASEVLAEFRYSGSLDRTEAQTKARESRLRWKTKRARVGVREIRDAVKPSAKCDAERFGDRCGVCKP